MTRILQVRRGTTVQNNNFTGLTGEVSYDTDAKTLRVHDGQTPGGFALARADQIGSGDVPGSGDDNTGDFDITTVPAEFWQSIMATYAPTPWQTAESRLSPIGNVSYLDYIFNIPTPFKFVSIVLVCQTPEADYSIGDVVSAWGIDNRANPSPNIFLDADNQQHVRLMIGGKNFWVSHKSTGATTPVTNNRWKAKCTVWY